MGECIFCKLGQDKKVILHENNFAYVLLDIHPINKGHCLIVLKEHQQDIYSIPSSALHGMIELTQQVAVAAKKATGADGINLGMNNGGAAGQIVFHAHVHVIPRFSHDGLVNWPSKEYASGEMQQYAEKMKKALQ